MKFLITGASGFLGKRVVDAALRRGHSVRAVVRPAFDSKRLGWPDQVELCRRDLRRREGLADALQGVDCVLHLAAGVKGDDHERFIATVVTTENLLNAMADSEVRKLVLISSFSVYDYGHLKGSLDEQSPVLTAEGDLYERDGYAIAKVWQERITREMAEKHGWQLCILRPGFIWGPGNEELAGVGYSLGPLFFRVMGGKRLPLTFVDNAADAIIQAAETDAAYGETINLVDSEGESPTAYDRQYRRWFGRRGPSIPWPYFLGMVQARIAKTISRLLFGKHGKLPGIIVPARFAARFKPLRFSTDKLRSVLSWQPPVPLAEAFLKTFSIPIAHKQPSDRPASATPHDIRSV